MPTDANRNKILSTDSDANRAMTQICQNIVRSGSTQLKRVHGCNALTEHFDLFRTLNIELEIKIAVDELYLLLFLVSATDVLKYNRKSRVIPFVQADNAIISAAIDISVNLILSLVPSLRIF
jgi:hypothetical protein